MNATRVAIEKNRVTIIALLIVIFGGVGAYRSMPRNEDPGFVVRTALVITRFPGASPERVEQLVTDRIEKAAQEIPELESVESESKTGLSLVWVNIKESQTEMRPIWDNLRRKVEGIRSGLPDGIIGPIVNDEFGEVYGIVIAITGGEEHPSTGVRPEFDYRELKEIADEVRDELLLIDEVAKVQIHGAQDERIFVEYDNSRLSDLGLSPLQLKQILEAQNIINPGGAIRTEFEEFVLEPSGNFETLEQLKTTVIQIPGSTEVLFLGDVAEIRRGYIDPPRMKMRASGVRALGLSISMREGGNILVLGQAVRDTLARVQAGYPIGVEFDVLQFQPDVVRRKIRDFTGNLVQAVVIVTLVMLLTLGLRTGLVVSSLIPMAMLTSFMVMRILGIGLDQMSIASLVIALGMLVDNAIVMSESIMVQMAAGKKAKEAAIDSAVELRVPLLTSSLTTAAAFLPIFLAESSTGEYTAPLFKVVTITLICSWVLSLTMVPMLCVMFLRIKTHREGERRDSAFYGWYRAALVRALRRPLGSLAAVVVVFAVSLFGFRVIPNIFFPANDRPTFTAEVYLPSGTPATRTDSIVAEIEGFIEDSLTAGPERPEGVTKWGTFIGEGGPRFYLTYRPQQPRSDFAFILLNATSRRVIDELVPKLEDFCRRNYPDVKAVVRPMALGPPAWPPIEIRISGRDTDKLFRIVEEVKSKLRKTPGAKLVDDDWGARSKKLFVRIDQPRARRAGVTSQAVAVSLQAFLSGLQATGFREDDQVIPITLRSVAAERQDIDKLETLNVYSRTTGQSVPLKQVADVEVVFQPSVIQRYDRIRTVTVESELEPGFTASDVNSRLVPWLEQQSAEWGLGYGWALGGEAETSIRAQDSIKEKLPVAGLVIVLLLVAQFNSFRRPLIILMTIPLSIIGVVVGLLAARSYFGFMTLLGIVSLAGIVINNAIVLLDRIRIEIENNRLSPARAVVESAQKRLRPILLTTGTTVGGLLPLWVGGGPIFRPMAIAIVFGLIFATLLTLGVVPVLYSILYRVDFRGFEYDPSAAQS